MRYSSTVPPIMALLRTRRASLRSSYLVLVTPFNSHDVIQRRIFRRPSPFRLEVIYPTSTGDPVIGKAHRLEAGCWELHDV
jgi:hypothetical protein